MISCHVKNSLFLLLFLVTCSLAAKAQPTLPDLVGDEQNGLVLLSWTCQYDGVKSIAVLRSADSSYNYSTIGYVKKLYKGVQAYADGHPMPGKNYYKLSVVFNSGLTWGTNHCGVYVDSIAVRKGRAMPSNEALQKLIVTETEKVTQPTKQEKVEKQQSNKVRNAVAPADKDQYMEVYKKTPTPAPAIDTIAAVEIPKPKYKAPTADDGEAGVEQYISAEKYVASLPEETRKKITITYGVDTAASDVSNYIDNQEGVAKQAEAQQKVNVTFEDKKDIAAFVSTLPKSETRKFTVTFNKTEPNDSDPSQYLEEDKKPEPKKVSVTLNDEKAVKAYVETLPKSAQNKITVTYNVDTLTNNAKVVEDARKEVIPPPRQKITIKFNDDMNVNEAADVKSKYVFNDVISGNVTMSLPDDVATHHYSIRFLDKDNHAVIEIPKINTAKIILDKRNFQKKTQYKFILRRDVVELESGYVNIY